MTVRYTPEFINGVKNLNVRVRKSFKEKIDIFKLRPYDPQLVNHQLKREYLGYRSINITSNYRAIYKEIDEGREKVAYFVTIGTHKELYG